MLLLMSLLLYVHNIIIYFRFILKKIFINNSSVLNFKNSIEKEIKVLIVCFESV